MTSTVLASPDLVVLAKEHHGDVRAFLAAEEGSELVEKVIEAIATGDPITISSLVGDLTPNQAAQMLGVSRPTLMKWINDGVIESRRVGTHHRLRVADVLKVRSTRERGGRTDR